MPIHKILKHSDNFVLLFCIIDDLCKALLPPETHSVGRKAKMSRSELITVAVIFSITGQNTFYGFYRVFRLCNFFQLPEYSRLLRNIKTVSYETHIIVRMLMQLNRFYHREQLMLIDSAPLPVCRNKRIFGYKVTKLADRGMSSMGWFFGFKLHVVAQEDGILLNFMVTPGNVSDKNHELVLKMFEGLRGMAVGDKGYLSLPLAKKLQQQGVGLFTGFYQNTKRMVMGDYHKKLKLRQMVETAIGGIKFRKNCASSLPRSVDGYFWRYVSAIFAYILCTQYF